MNLREVYDHSGGFGTRLCQLSGKAKNARLIGGGVGAGSGVGREISRRTMR